MHLEGVFHKKSHCNEDSVQQKKKKKKGLPFISLRFAKYLTGVRGFLCGSAGKESDYNAGDLGSIPGLGRCPGEGKGYQLQYFGLESSMDCTVHGVAKSWTQLSDFHFLLTGVHLWNEWIHSYFHPFV